MGLEDDRNKHGSIAARIFRDESFIGTGFLVCSDHILTCFHLIKDLDVNETLKIWFSGGTLLTGKVKATNQAQDLALIEIPVQEWSIPVRFLIGLKMQHEDVLRQLNWQAIGYDFRNSETFLTAISLGHDLTFQWDNKTNTLLEFQVNLGLPDGFSGGPVMAELWENTFCLGISTLGGTDRPKSRIRLADCIVGFLEGCELAVKTQAAYEVFPMLATQPMKILPTQQANIIDPGKRSNSWRWMVAVGLLAAAALAALYYFWKPASIERPIVTTPTPALTPVPTVLPSYQVRVMLYSSNAPPQLYINKKRATLDAYDGRTATLRLHPGSYQVEADYDSIGQICTAIVSVPHELSTEAECHLK